MPTPSQESVPPVVWDVIPDLFKAIVASAGPNLHPMHFQVAMGFIYRLRERKALEPRKHDPKSPKVLEAWLKGTPLVLTEKSLSGLACELMSSLREMVPSFRMKSISSLPSAPRPDGVPIPGSIGPFERHASVFPLSYNIEERVRGSTVYYRTDTASCEGFVDLEDFVGLNDREIQDRLDNHARENWESETTGGLEYGDTDTGEETDDTNEIDNVRLNNLDALIDAVREYEENHA